MVLMVAEVNFETIAGSFKADIVTRWPGLIVLGSPAWLSHPN